MNYIFCLVLNAHVHIFCFRVKRHTADMKIAQYMACMSVRAIQNKDCRNIGWGLVDIFER